MVDQISKDPELLFGKELWNVAQEKIPDGKSSDYYLGVAAAYLHVLEILKFIGPDITKLNIVLTCMSAAASKNLQESFPQEI